MGEIKLNKEINGIQNGDLRYEYNTKYKSRLDKYDESFYINVSESSDYQKIYKVFNDAVFKALSDYNHIRMVDDSSEDKDIQINGCLYFYKKRLTHLSKSFLLVTLKLFFQLCLLSFCSISFI